MRGLALLTTFGFSSMLVAQLSTVDPRARFEVSGRVLDADTLQPIPRARISIQVRPPVVPVPPSPGGFDRLQQTRSVPKAIVGPATPRPPSADTLELTLLTDQAGVFRLTNASPGQYSVAASRSGYLVGYQFGRPSNTQFSIAGSSPSPVTLYLRRQAVIEGTILDPQGNGIQGMVSAFRLVVRSGRPTPGSLGAVQVDPEGYFRLVGLNPGRYYVAFAPHHSVNSRRMTFPFAFYPGVSTVQAARLVQVGAGAREEIHMRLQEEPAFRLSGIIPDQSQPRSWSLKPLVPHGMRFQDSFNSYIAPSGEFQFDAVPAGQYVMTFEAGKAKYRSQTIIVGGRDLEKIALTPDSYRLEFRVSYDQAPSVSGSAPPSVSVGLESENREIYAQKDPQGMLSIESVPPGSHPLRVQTVNPAYVRSARQGGRDVLRDGVLVLAGDTPEPVEIAIGYGKARVEASISPADSQQTPKTIVFLRWTGADWAMRHQHVLQARERSVVIDAMPPGDYRVFAWDNGAGSVEEVPYATEAFQRTFGSFLEKFSIRDAERVSVTIQRYLPAAALDAY